MKCHRLLAATLWIACGLAGAQTTAAPSATPKLPAPAAAPAPAGLYQALGEKEGIDRFVSDFVDRVYQDKRILAFFKDTKASALKESLAEQFCALSGGPCTYQGADMQDVHADMKVRKADFNALVEDLQHAMDAHGIAFTQQNRLLALLAPMHRDIITVH